MKTTTGGFVKTLKSMFNFNVLFVSILNFNMSVYLLLSLCLEVWLYGSTSELLDDVCIF